MPTPARQTRERGAALLVVTVAIAVLTALAVDLAYQARVSLQSSVDARDELRAECLAKSGVNLSRLVLYFQQQLDTATGGQAGKPQPPTAMPIAIPRLRLWSIVPVSSSFLAGLFEGGMGPAGEGEKKAPAAEGEKKALSRFGDFAGGFDAKIEDENRKVNVQFDASGASGVLGAQVAAYFALVGDRKWDFLFDREDENGVKASRDDVAIYLHDWVDDLDVASALNRADPAKPFVDGFGDENFPYDRGPDRYRTKNARFDSLDEVHLVAGVSDAFMAAFGGRLTVYPRPDAPLDVNTQDPVELLRNTLIMALPGQPILSDPTFPERLQKAVREVTRGGLLTISPVAFSQILAALGVSVNPLYTSTNTDQRGAFGDTTQVFHVRATGTAGTVDRTLDVVVTFDPAQQVGQPPAELGRVLHWGME
jgi:general secretion pathway protein K